MDFQILTSKFRKLEHEVLGLSAVTKTKEEMKTEILDLEKKIKEASRRDVGIPYKIVNKVFEDINKVKEKLFGKTGEKILLSAVELPKEPVGEPIIGTTEPVVEETAEEPVEEKKETTKTKKTGKNKSE